MYCVVEKTIPEHYLDSAFYLCKPISFYFTGGPQFNKHLRGLMMPWWCPSEAHHEQIVMKSILAMWTLRKKRKKKKSCLYLRVGITSVPALKVFPSDDM